MQQVLNHKTLQLVLDRMQLSLLGFRFHCAH